MNDSRSSSSGRFPNQPPAFSHLSEELARRSLELDKRASFQDEREVRLDKKEESLAGLATKIALREEELIKKLQEVASLTKIQAKDLLLEELEKNISSDIAKRVREAEAQIKTEADSRAKEILIESMRHGLVDFVAEYTVSTLRLPNDETKGRIIGKEGRNIRTFEQETGVELEMDEDLDIRLSSFDPIRREVARLSLEKLIRDTRIQPSRIEEVVRQTKAQMDQILMEEGRKIAQACGVFNLHPDLIKIIGRYKFRSSYGQNLAVHTIEETKIGVQIAHELKGDIETVRLGCLLHDIGKVITEEEGTHVQLGVDLLKKYDIPEAVINCVAEHHEDKPFSSIESTIVWIADAISGSRPGARYEAFEEYAERMGKIEELVKSFSGVGEAYAFQAGRDVRVIVKPEEVSEADTVLLARKIAGKIEAEVRYAGQVKVTVIRETRTTETTKAK
ncbi:MAG: Ribonuclease Y [Microgenomates group bacterium GW2011_GWA2_44_7]|nr:MAG: Ribonuclease Y [Microgenomates group bacterium GW2011_GWA2_44_7]